MHRSPKQFLWIVLLGLLAGCNLPAAPARTTPTDDTVPAYQTVAVILTQTALSSGVSTILTASTTPDLTLQATPAPSTVTPLASVMASPASFTPTPICNLAQAGRPIDVTIPDDTKMEPGTIFVKTWRLVNSGTCAWTQNYGIVWFSGDDMGVNHQAALKGNVQPGQSVDISLEMMSPDKPGSYQSNWKLINERGDLFGIGPGGGSPFWVRIEVIAADTPTPTVSLATLTPTFQASFNDSATLEINQGVDLDNGQINNGTDDDLVLHIQDTNLELEWENGARGGQLRGQAPSLADCQAAALNTNPIPLAAEIVGRYICVRTSRGLPGSINLVSIDLANSRVIMTFTVWSVP